MAKCPRCGNPYINISASSNMISNRVKCTLTCTNCRHVEDTYNFNSWGNYEWSEVNYENSSKQMLRRVRSISRSP